MLFSSEIIERARCDQSGRLEETPFPVLLRVLWESHRTCTVRLERQRVWKAVAIERGVPVGCESNLAQERFGRFLVDLGRIDEPTFAGAFSESLTRSAPLGEVLVDRGALDSDELLKLLRQCVAKQLLDLFAWEEGRFEIGGEPISLPAPLAVNTPQLILTGCTRLASQRQIDGSVMSVIGASLRIDGERLESLPDLQFDGAQQHLVDLLSQPRTLSELNAESDMETDDVARLIYALSALGLLVSADRVHDTEPPEDATPRVSQEPREPESGDSGARDAGNGWSFEKVDPPPSADELQRFFLAHRRRDAFDLLDVHENASDHEIVEAYLATAQRMAPWRFDDRELQTQAGDLFLALARAYAELAEPEGREALRYRRRLLREQREREGRGPQRIETELLDASAQFEEGRRLIRQNELKKASQHLELACECDPGNALYRAEAAYCRFSLEPGSAKEALRSLAEALRLDPDCGLAHLYAGEVATELKRYDEAETLLRAASRLLAPDRRPIERLKELGRRRKETGRRRVLGRG